MSYPFFAACIDQKNENRVFLVECAFVLIQVLGSKEKSIEDIRKILEESKLVKPAKEGKKVPDDILRNIYKDYLLLRNKAL